MENEAVSKNFIEQEIDKDLARMYAFPAGTERISAYRTCKINSFELWSCTEVWRNVPYAF